MNHRSFPYRKNEESRVAAEIEISMNVEHGCIMEYRSFGDYFGNGDTEELQETLKGCPLHAGRH